MKGYLLWQIPSFIRCKYDNIGKISWNTLYILLELPRKYKQQNSYFGLMKLRDKVLVWKHPQRQKASPKILMHVIYQRPATENCEETLNDYISYYFTNFGWNELHSNSANLCLCLERKTDVISSGREVYL